MNKSEFVAYLKKFREARRIEKDMYRKAGADGFYYINLGTIHTIDHFIEVLKKEGKNDWSE